MPTLGWNLRQWDRDYTWSQAGDEWSGAWGGVNHQWFGTLLPRLRDHLPAETILEIGPGHGRWTQYLKDSCARLIVVDISQTCIDRCRERFAEASHIEYHVNDGKSLEMVREDSVDFAFSFDSLVHVEAEVMDAYLHGLRRVLRRNGFGMIHHSNLGEYQRYFRIVKRAKLMVRSRRASGRAPAAVTAGNEHAGAAEVPALVSSIWKWMRKAGFDSDHSRALTMTAGEFEAAAHRNGLRCLSQEKVNWGTRRAIDCISVFARADCDWTEGNRVTTNTRFMAEARRVRAIGDLYALRPQPPAAR